MKEKFKGQKLLKRLGDHTLNIGNNITTFRIIGYGNFIVTLYTYI